MDPKLQEIYEKINETNGQIDSFYPNTLMIANAIAACLDDEDISTRKNCLDFVIKFVDLDNPKLFDDVKKDLVFTSLIRILDNNDLSIVRRVFKRRLFDANDLGTVEVNDRNKRMVYFLGRGFRAQLALPNLTGEDLRRPFKILGVLHKSNAQLTRQVIYQNALKFADFMFQNGYVKPSDYNHMVVEQTKGFIKDFEPYFEDFLEAINVEIRESPMNTEQLLLIEFVDEGPGGREQHRQQRQDQVPDQPDGRHLPAVRPPLREVPQRQAAVGRPGGGRQPGPQPAPGTSAAVPVRGHPGGPDEDHKDRH